MFAKTFRNTLIASTLVIAGSVLATPAMAEGTTVVLGGTVTSTSAVNATRTTGAGFASALNLYGAGTAGTDVIVKVADLALSTNNSSGFTLTATGDAGLDNGVDTVAYEVLIVADQLVTPTPPISSAFSSVTDDDTVDDIVAGAAARDLYIMYTAPAILDSSAAYTSTITLSLVDL